MQRLSSKLLSSWIGLFLLVLVAVFQPTRVFAQGSVAGKVMGTITDPTQSLVPDAQVTLRNVQTNETRTATTTKLGTYEFLNVPIGHYRVTVDHPGFSKLESADIEVTVQNASVLDLTLVVGNVSQTVTVDAGALVINTTDATLGGLVDNRKVTELPLNGRSFVDLLDLQPGVTPLIVTGGGRTSATRNDGGFINGTDDFYNDFTIDGGDFNDIDVPGSGINKALIGTGVPPDAIAEFRVITAAADAEFGTLAGAHVNVVTKSGTNEFHGTAWEFFRNQSLDSRSYFDAAGPKLPFALNQFGGVIGGPVKKDKNFFFGSFEEYHQTLQTTALPVVPTPLLLGDIPAGPLKSLMQAFYPLPTPGSYSATALIAPIGVTETQNNDRESFIVRDDEHLTDKDTISGRIVYNHATGTPGVILSTGLVGGNSGFGWQTTNPQVTYTRLISATTVNEARFTYNRTALSVDFDAPPAAVTELGYSSNALLATAVPNISFSGTGLTNIGWGTSPQGRHVNVFEWTDTLTKTKGRWTIMTGFAAFRYQPNIIGDDTPTPTITFSGFGEPISNSPNGITTGIFASQTQTFNVEPLNSSLRYPRYSLFGVFEQNTFQARKNLTLTFGLRYEINTIPTEKFGIQTNLYQLNSAGQPTLNPITNIANVELGQPSVLGLPYASTHKGEFEPRLGLAWSPFNSKRIVIRGGYGIYYQRPDLFAYPLGTSNPPFSIPTDIVNQPFGTIANPANFLTTNKSISVYDPSNKPISVQSYNLNLQFKTDAHGFLQVGYSGSHTVHYNIGTDPNFGNAFVGVRPNPNFLTIALEEDLGNSHYNSLQAEYNHSYGHGVTSQVSYTYASDIGLVEAGVVPTSHTNFSLDTGPMDASIRHELVVSVVYELPFGRGKAMLNSGLLSKILGNWAVSGVNVTHSGMPFSILAGSDTQDTGNITERATLLSGQNITSLYDNGVNKAQFLLPQTQVLNTILAPTGGALLGRNDITGPAFFNLDLGVQKNIFVREHDHLEFRGELFNSTNHTNFSNPNATLTSPLFGQILSAVSTGRQVQLAVKYYF